MTRDGGAVMITFQDRMVSVALMMDLRCSYTYYYYSVLYSVKQVYNMEDHEF